MSNRCDDDPWVNARWVNVYLREDGSRMVGAFEHESLDTAKKFRDNASREWLGFECRVTEASGETAAYFIPKGVEPSEDVIDDLRSYRDSQRMSWRVSRWLARKMRGLKR